jgi:hypothetical protein
MWICTNQGFISAVDKAKNRKRDLHVRSRRKDHLKAIFPHLKDGDIAETMGGDYRFRADIPRAVVAQVVGALLTGIQYDNFKDSVKEKDLHDAYAGVWSVIGTLQAGGPYNWDSRKRGRAADLFRRDEAPEDDVEVRSFSDAGLHVCEDCLMEAASFTVRGKQLCDGCAIDAYGADAVQGTEAAE